MTPTDPDTDARLLQDSAHRLFAAHFGAPNTSEPFNQAGWEAVEAAGLPRALLTEGQGGYGIAPVDALGLLRVAGEHAVTLPVAETMLAAWLLAGAGLPVPEGPLSVATGPTLQAEGTGWRVSGEASGVKWGRDAAAIALLAPPFVAVLPRGAAALTQGRNIAGEPCDMLGFDTVLSAEQVAGSDTDAARLHAMGAAMRCLLLAGAMARVAEMTARYAQERVQFGRPIGKFQAVQQLLAVLAGQTAAACAAADMAAEAVADGVRVLPIACAKVRAGEAAGVVAALAHQVHGAIGFAEEHRLHHYTRRLWAWRDEYGGEAEWSLLVGRRFAMAGADRLWADIAAI